MMKYVLFVLLLFSFAFGSCNAQSSDKWLWKTFESPEAGFSIAFPCEPSKNVKTFQEQPKLARLFEFKCERDGFKFSVSLPERFGEFNARTANESLTDVERFLRDSIGDNARVTSRDLEIQIYAAKEFEVENGSTLGRQLHVEHPRGGYNVQIIFTRPVNQSRKASQAEYQKVAKSFFDSFTILENS